MKKRKIIYIDMDNVLADYLGHSISLQIDPNVAKHVPGFFASLLPIDGAIEAYNELTKNYDVYILTGRVSQPEMKEKTNSQNLPNYYKYEDTSYRSIILLFRPTFSTDNIGSRSASGGTDVHQCAECQGTGAQQGSQSGQTVISQDRSRT